MEFIHTVYFINLEKRKDRRDQFENEMQRMGFPCEKVHRIEAVSKPGIEALGCSYSHVKAIDAFLSTNAEYCMIFEDDFQFTIDLHYLHFLLRYIFTTKFPFDIVSLGGYVLQDEETELVFFRRIYEMQTSSGYLVTREFAPILKKNLEEGIALMEKEFAITKKIKEEYCLDMYWKQLQPKSRWYILQSKFGLQRESYSDIQREVTNYRV